MVPHDIVIRVILSLQTHAKMFLKHMGQITMLFNVSRSEPVLQEYKRKTGNYRCFQSFSKNKEEDLISPRLQRLRYEQIIKFSDVQRRPFCSRHGTWAWFLLYWRWVTQIFWKISLNSFRLETYSAFLVYLLEFMIISSKARILQSQPSQSVTVTPYSRIG